MISSCDGVSETVSSRIGSAWKKFRELSHVSVGSDMVREERMRTIERNGESELEQKLLTPASRDKGIKMDIVVIFCLSIVFNL